MSVYKPTMLHMREVLLYYFNSNNSAAEAHRMLVHAYGKGIISQFTCQDNFRRFRSGDFNLNRRTFKLLNKERLIEEFVRLRLENPRMTQTMMAAKLGVSRKTLFRLERSQEYQNKLKEKEQEQSSILLERPSTSRTPSTQLEDEELVHFMNKFPDITEDEMLTNVGMSTSKFISMGIYSE